MNLNVGELLKIKPVALVGPSSEVEFLEGEKCPLTVSYFYIFIILYSACSYLVRQIIYSGLSGHEVKSTIYMRKLVLIKTVHSFKSGISSCAVSGMCFVKVRFQLNTVARASS
jgi:hypothetical protein